METNPETSEKANYVQAKQNGQHLIDSGSQEYKLVRKRGSKAYYRCTEKKRSLCKATAVVEGEFIIKKIGEHNHDSSLLKKRVREMENEAIKAASTSHTSPRSVLCDLTSNVTNVSSGRPVIFTFDLLFR